METVEIINRKESSCSEKPNSSDTISRQAAIGAICTEGTRLERNGTVAMAEIKQWCVDILEALPSAQPERKTGHWEIYIISMLDGEGCRCSECGSEGVPYWDFCPNCGADMRGDDADDIG